MRTAAVLAALALLATPRRRALVTHSRAARPPRRRGHDPSASRLPAAVLGGAGVAVLVGGSTGIVVGLGATGGLSWWLASLPSRAAVERERSLRADLPMAADLLAACLSAGAAPSSALEAVARAVGGDLGSVLVSAARRWSLSGSLADAFGGIAECAPGAPLHVLATVCSRAERGGGSAVPLLTSCARDLREVRRTELDVRARRAGAFAVAPLGLCFLPAFVLVGIVPLVAGLVRDGVTGVP
jgi:Flp pilus assembly protein TadB